MPTIEGIALAQLPVGQRVYYKNKLATVTKEFIASEGLRILLDGDTHDRFVGGTQSLGFVWEEQVEQDTLQYVLELPLVTIAGGFIVLVVSRVCTSNLWEFMYSLVARKEIEEAGFLSSPILTGTDPKKRSFDTPEDAKNANLVVVARLLRLDTL
ncbi:MAG: hypothetical protein DRJ03_24095 [Chloroflexi bacterium]|nr:MAG: hypothetical protein DRJ03_24095 [Chloroflexota bacterium]